MFTGIIEEVGTLLRLSGAQLTVRCERILADIAVGDSISVDGICLTVVDFDRAGFSAGLSPETVERTTLAHRPPGSLLNLESAVRAGGKLGGHIVSGHVDGVGSCVASVRRGEAWEVDFEVPPPVARYVVEKGSIAINGISLTVAACSPAGDWLRVAAIPHSFNETNLGRLRPGDLVNLEADLVGKYVEKLLAGRTSDSGISRAFLAEHGY